MSGPKMYAGSYSGGLRTSQHAGGSDRDSARVPAFVVPVTQFHPPISDLAQFAPDRAQFAPELAQFEPDLAQFASAPAGANESNVIHSHRIFSNSRQP